MTPVRLPPAVPRSRVKHSITVLPPSSWMKLYAYTVNVKKFNYSCLPKRPRQSVNRGGGGGGGGGGSDHFYAFKGGGGTLIISMHLRVFSEGQGTEWRIFLGLL